MQLLQLQKLIQESNLQLLMVVQAEQTRRALTSTPMRIHSLQDIWLPDIQKLV
jgi:hypothetical protein